MYNGTEGVRGCESERVQTSTESDGRALRQLTARQSGWAASRNRFRVQSLRFEELSFIFLRRNSRSSIEARYEFACCLLTPSSLPRSPILHISRRHYSINNSARSFLKVKA